MEQDNENSKELLQEDNEQDQELGDEDNYSMDYSEDFETYDEESEINPDYIFREDDQTFLLKNGSYQILNDEVLSHINNLRNESKKE